jgi:hypothetical protein
MSQKEVARMTFLFSHNVAENEMPLAGGIAEQKLEDSRAVTSYRVKFQRADHHRPVDFRFSSYA